MFIKSSITETFPKLKRMHLRPEQPQGAGTLSRRDFQRIVAEMIG